MWCAGEERGTGCFSCNIGERVSGERGTPSGRIYYGTASFLGADWT